MPAIENTPSQRPTAIDTYTPPNAATAAQGTAKPTPGVTAQASSIPPAEVSAQSSQSVTKSLAPSYSVSAADAAAASPRFDKAVAALSRRSETKGDDLSLDAIFKYLFAAAMQLMNNQIKAHFDESQRALLAKADQSKAEAGKLNEAANVQSGAALKTMGLHAFAAAATVGGGFVGENGADVTPPGNAADESPSVLAKVWDGVTSKEGMQGTNQLLSAGGDFTRARGDAASQINKADAGLAAARGSELGAISEERKKFEEGLEQTLKSIKEGAQQIAAAEVDRTRVHV